MESNYLTYTLYFGLHDPVQDKIISEDEVSDFIKTMPFKSFTIIDAVGYWHSKEEPSKVVTIITNDASWKFHDSIVKTCSEYKKRFNQQSVLGQVHGYELKTFII